MRAALSGALLLPGDASAQRRVMQPEDLFRVERVGAIAWSPDGRRATVPIHRPGKWLDTNIPTARIYVLDVASRTFRMVSPSSQEFVGFFGATWSPNGRRLAFLSVDMRIGREMPSKSLSRRMLSKLLHSLPRRHIARSR